MMSLSFVPSVASVGLEQTFYQVNESAGSVEVCAAVYPVSECPIAASFHILLATLDDTAGIAFLFCPQLFISFKFCTVTL